MVVSRFIRQSDAAREPVTAPPARESHESQAA
jgi:hypothetical protein